MNPNTRSKAMYGAIKIKAPKIFYPLIKILSYLGAGSSKRKRFSLQVQAAVENSREQALQRDHNCIECEHLLLSMIKQSPGKIHEVLKSLGCDIMRLQHEIAEVVATYPKKKPNAAIPFSKQVAMVFGLACGIADEFNSATIETEHLFLAMLKQENNLLVQIYKKLGISYEDFYNQLKRLSAN
jgi:ATP-dependent Clp protease ATP-binding subunit ClpC